MNKKIGRLAGCFQACRQVHWNLAAGQTSRLDGGWAGRQAALQACRWLVKHAGSCAIS